MKFQDEIKRRRTFGIVSHPDAGKTTLTEKLLLFGGAIHQLGTERHHSRYLEQIHSGQLLGCFAMTETGHGSNVKSLETSGFGSRRG